MIKHARSLNRLPFALSETKETCGTKQAAKIVLFRFYRCRAIKKGSRTRYFNPSGRTHLFYKKMNSRRNTYRQIRFARHAMRYFLFLFIMFLPACSGITVPNTFTYKEAATATHTLASWQKITDKTAPLRIYVEGDGYAFDRFGNPTDDPTPKSTLVRKLAFNDPNPNVAYVARPCQFIKTALCTQKAWSTGRFSKEAVQALYEASKAMAEGREIIYIGYSGGALLTGLAIQEYPDLNVKKWITLAGLLDHKAWTDCMHLYPLTHSLNLTKLPDIPQIHFIGGRDKIIPLPFMQKTAKGKKLVVIKNAEHNQGLEQAAEQLYRE